MSSSTTVSSRRSGGREQDRHTTAAAASEQDLEAIAVAEAIEGFQDDDLGHLREATVVAVESSNNGQQEILASYMEQQQQQGGQQEDEERYGTICVKITAALVCIGLAGVAGYFTLLLSFSLFSVGSGLGLLFLAGFVVTLVLCVNSIRCIFGSRPTRQEQTV